MGYAEAIEKQVAAAKWHRTSRGQENIKQLHESNAIMGEEDPQWDELLRRAEGWLMRAEPFYVSPAIGTLLESAAASLPRISVRQEDPPAREGWVYFDGGIALPTTPQFDAYIKARQQMTGAERLAVTPRYAGMYWAVEASGIVTIFYASEDSYWGGPVPLQVKCWDWGVDWEPQPGDEDIDPMLRRLFGVMLTFFTFVKQRLLSASARGVTNRGARRRLAKVIEHEPIVRVVALRARDYEQHDGSHPREVEWSCQWLVRGHWRQHYYPVSGEHRPLWIEPHIKGPSDKPLRVAEKVAYEVVR